MKSRKRAGFVLLNFRGRTRTLLRVRLEDEEVALAARGYRTLGIERDDKGVCLGLWQP